MLRLLFAITLCLNLQATEAPILDPSGKTTTFVLSRQQQQILARNNYKIISLADYVEWMGHHRKFVSVILGNGDSYDRRSQLELIRWFDQLDKGVPFVKSAVITMGALQQGIAYDVDRYVANLPVPPRRSFQVVTKSELLAFFASPRAQHDSRVTPPAHSKHILVLPDVIDVSDAPTIPIAHQIFADMLLVAGGSRHRQLTLFAVEGGEREVRLYTTLYTTLKMNPGGFGNEPRILLLAGAQTANPEVTPCLACSLVTANRGTFIPYRIEYPRLHVKKLDTHADMESSDAQVIVDATASNQKPLYVRLPNQPFGTLEYSIHPVATGDSRLARIRFSIREYSELARRPSFDMLHATLDSLSVNGKVVPLSEDYPEQGSETQSKMFHHWAGEIVANRGALLNLRVHGEFNQATQPYQAEFLVEVPDESLSAAQMIKLAPKQIVQSTVYSLAREELIACGKIVGEDLAAQFHGARITDWAGYEQFLSHTNVLPAFDRYRIEKLLDRVNALRRLREAYMEQKEFRGNLSQCVSHLVHRLRRAP